MITKFFFSPANHGIHKKLQISSNIKLTNLKKIKSDHRACITFPYIISTRNLQCQKT